MELNQRLVTKRYLENAKYLEIKENMDQKSSLDENSEEYFELNDNENTTYQNL